jgi:hypothetical protein
MLISALVCGGGGGGSAREGYPHCIIFGVTTREITNGCYLTIVVGTKFKMRIYLV